MWQPQVKLHPGHPGQDAPLPIPSLTSHLGPKFLKISFRGNHQTPHPWFWEQERNWLGSFLLSRAPGLPGPRLPNGAPSYPAQHSCPGAASMWGPAQCLPRPYSHLGPGAVSACQPHRSRHIARPRHAPALHVPFSPSGSPRPSYHPLLLDKSRMLSGAAGSSKPALPSVLPCSADGSSILTEAQPRSWGLTLISLLPSCCQSGNTLKFPS